MTTTGKRIASIVAGVGLLGGAVAAAWWFTRTDDSVTAVAPVADEHAGHTGAGAPAAEGRPVTLTAGDARRLGVTYAKAERLPLSDEVRIVGIVAYDETRVKAIAPKVEGWVEQLDVAYPGQTVEVGAPLLRIYSPMVVTVQEELLLAKKLAGDAADSGAKRNADALVAAARRRLRYWDIPDDAIARVEQTGEVARTVTLRSPVRGVVVRLGVRAGQRIMAGEAVYEVADLSEVWLEGEVFDRDMAALRIGQTVTADFASRPGETFHGRIAFIDPTVNPDTRTLRVRVTLPNPGLLLKPGMYATLHVRDPARMVLQIPRSAVLVTGLRSFVFVLDSMGMLVPRDVTIGQTTATRVEIVRGLTAGETVVASATFLIDAESNLGAAVAAMANMPGMSDVPGTPNRPPKK